MFDLVDQSLTVFILTARDQDHRKLISRCSQALQQLGRIHSGHKKVEHDAAPVLWKPGRKNIGRTAESFYLETCQAYEASERTQQRFIVIDQYNRWFTLLHLVLTLRRADSVLRGQFQSLPV